MMPRLTTDVAALVLRVAAGSIFLPHGWSKIAGDGGAAAFAGDIAANYGIPAFFGHAAAWAEVAGAVLLILGLITRLDALLLAATMSVAAFVVQLPDALYEVPPNAIKFFVVIRGIELPLAMLSITIALMFLGAGRISLDYAFGIDAKLSAVMRKKKAAAEAAAVRV
jgi:putative oxidoreductase